MMWFRVQLGPDGKVVKVDPVESQLENEQFVFYISVCRSNKAATKERARMRERPDATGIRLEKSAARSRDRRAEMRHEVLLELERVLATCKSVAAARVWTRQEIRKLQKLPTMEAAS